MNFCVLNCVIQRKPSHPWLWYDPDYHWRAMNGPDHYREAERLLHEAECHEEPDSSTLWRLELAKLHTALAQVAATALNSDGREWVEVAGRRFNSM